jgi:hypothetical protein
LTKIELFCIIYIMVRLNLPRSDEDEARFQHFCSLYRDVWERCGSPNSSRVQEIFIQVLSGEDVPTAIEIQPLVDFFNEQLRANTVPLNWFTNEGLRQLIAPTVKEPWRGTREQMKRMIGELLVDE